MMCVHIPVMQNGLDAGRWWSGMSPSSVVVVVARARRESNPVPPLAVVAA